MAIPVSSQRAYNTSGRPPGDTAHLLVETKWQFHSSAKRSNSHCRYGMKQYRRHNLQIGLFMLSYGFFFVKKHNCLFKQLIVQLNSKWLTFLLFKVISSMENTILLNIFEESYPPLTLSSSQHAPPSFDSLNKKSTHSLYDI